MTLTLKDVEICQSNDLLYVLDSHLHIIYMYITRRLHEKTSNSMGLHHGDNKKIMPFIGTMQNPRIKHVKIVKCVLDKKLEFYLGQLCPENWLLAVNRPTSPSARSAELHIFKLPFIRKICPCTEYPLKPHFYIVKLGYAGVYLCHPYLVSSANWQSRDLHSSPVIFLRDLVHAADKHNSRSSSRNTSASAGCHSRNVAYPHIRYRHVLLPAIT